jgi:hypothetical protein
MFSASPTILGAPGGTEKQDGFVADTSATKARNQRPTSVCRMRAETGRTSHLRSPVCACSNAEEVHIAPPSQGVVLPKTPLNRSSAACGGASGSAPHPPSGSGTTLRAALRAVLGPAQPDGPHELTVIIGASGSHTAGCMVWTYSTRRYGAIHDSTVSRCTGVW